MSPHLGVVMKSLVVFSSLLGVLTASLCTAPPETFPVHHSPKRRSLLGPPVGETLYLPMRLYFEYVDEASSDLKDMLDNAAHWYSQALKVHRLSDTLKLTATNCTGIEVSETLRVDGVDADAVIFVTTSDGNKTEGWGTVCELQTDSNYRPVAGRVHFKGDYAALTSEQQLAMALHQVAHVLAFNFELLPFFSGAIGEHLGHTTTYSFRDVRGVPTGFIMTPKVLEKAVNAFDCNSLYGMEVEPNDGVGIHWEKRIMYNDFMVGDLDLHSLVLSDISLALFEDSGWYTVNYAYSTSINFGFQRGCGFIHKNCIDSSKAMYNEFCTDTTGLSLCDFTRTYRGTCNLAKLNTLIPTSYQYFNDPYIGGADTLLDYCPIVKPTASCRDSSSETTDAYAEVLCNDCRCLEGTYVLQNSGVNAHYHSGCLEVKCRGSVATVFVGDLNVRCTAAGELVYPRGFDGYIVCPDTDILCRDAPCIDACNARGRCVNGGCECDTGYSGDSCENAGVWLHAISLLALLAV